MEKTYRDWKYYVSFDLHTLSFSNIINRSFGPNGDILFYSINRFGFWHDSKVFNQSIKQQVNVFGELGFHIVADAGFKNQIGLLTTRIKKNKTQADIEHREELASLRIFVEKETIK